MSLRSALAVLLLDFQPALPLTDAIVLGNGSRCGVSPHKDVGHTAFAQPIICQEVLDAVR